MHLTLMDGAFTAQEAEELLHRLVQVKTQFHLQKIDTSEQSEENMKHSEKRVKALEQDLRDAIAAVRANGGTGFVSMHATITSAVFGQAVPGQLLLPA